MPKLYWFIMQTLVIIVFLQLHHSLQETPQAISLLGQLLSSHHTLVDEEVINLLAELCIITKAYEQAYEARILILMWCTVSTKY